MPDVHPLYSCARTGFQCARSRVASPPLDTKNLAPWLQMGIDLNTENFRCWLVVLDPGAPIATVQRKTFEECRRPSRKVVVETQSGTSGSVWFGPTSAVSASLYIREF